MAKLYPPELSSKLPAFCNSYDETNINEFQGTTIKIPFTIGRQFNTNTISAMRIRIRTISTNTYIVEEYESIQCDFKNGIAIFSFSSQTKLFNEGQFYRVQVAFVDKITKQSGYYSEVSIIKCIAKPVVKIGNSTNTISTSNFLNDNDFYNSGNINNFDNKFLGVYIQDVSFGDTSEKAYSYIFNIYDSEDNLLLTSNSQVHDTINDINSDISYDFWQIYSELEESEIYFIEYIVTTINGYVVSSPKYKITKNITIPVVYKINLRANNNEEEGYIDINFDIPISNNENLQQVYYLLLSNDEEYDETVQYFIKVENNIIEYQEFNGNLVEWNQEILNQNLYEKNQDTYNLVTLNEIYNEEKNYYIKISNIEYNYEKFNGNIREWQNYLLSNRLYKALKSDVLGEEPYTGNFSLLRTSSESNFTEWITITQFSIQNQLLSTIHYKDQTVQQGIEYQYALQQFNIYNIKSKKIIQSIFNANTKEEEESTVIADFEHIYISDGSKQLKISLNPKISNFKQSIPETKIETIGSKFPFIFRNGSVSYQEFNISGLISYQTDLAKLFLSEEDYKKINMLEYKTSRLSSKPDISYGYFDEFGYHVVNEIKNSHEERIYFKEETKPIYDSITKELLYIQKYYVMCRKPYEKPQFNKYNITKNNLISEVNYLTDESSIVKTSTNLTSENILAERYFRQKVLEWLNNGQVKLFRSPTEGNFLVRILNVSMTPEERLSRLIYSFSATVDEIDYLNFENLVKYNIIKTNSSLNYENQWISINIKDKMQENNIKIDENNFILMNIEGITIDSVIINHFAPGDQIKIEYDEDNNLNGTIYTIGTTGSIDLNNDNRKIVRIWVKINELINNYNDFEREITYSYTSTSITEFDNISGVELSTETSEQFIGPKDNILEPYNLQYKCYGIPDKNGEVKNPISKEQGINNLYEDLLSHNYINYDIKISNNNNKSNIEKYNMVQVEILHAWKRDIIPIFAYNTNIINSNSQFGFTPFYKGYINNKNILNYLEYNSQEIKYTPFDNNINDYLPVMKENQQTNNLEDTGLVSVYDIITLGKMIDEKQQSLAIFKVFIYDENLNNWIPSTTPGFKYYDNYTKTWWENDEEYDASFIINDKPIIDEYYINPYNNLQEEKIYDTNIIGDNKIYLDDIKEITLYNLGPLNKIVIGNGVVIELTYQKRTTNYDLEETNYEILNIKKEYNNLINNSTEQLNNVLDIFYNKEQLEAQQALINNKLNILKIRLGMEEHDTSYSVTQEAALKRVIEQKQKLWYNRAQAVFEIMDYLKSFKLYKDIDVTPSINIVKGYTLISDPEQVNEEKTNITEMIKQIQSNNYNENSLFSENTIQNLFLTKLPFSVKEIQGKFYNYIDKECYVNVEYYKQQKNRYEEIVNNYESQIVELQSQQGSLIGGFDINDYNTNSPPPEGTLIYYEYMLNEVDQNYGNELLKLSQAKSKLVNTLLSRNYNEVDNLLLTIQNSTTNYLKDNAASLIKLLQNYINRANIKLKSIKDLVIQDIGNIIFNSNNAENFNLNNDQKKEIEYIITDKFNTIYLNTEENTSAETYIIKEGIKCIQIKNDIGRIISSTYEDITKTKIYTQIGKLFYPEKSIENLYNDLLGISNNYKVLQYLEQNIANLTPYCKSYELYGLTLQNQVDTWSNLIEILQDIQNHPGNEGRNYNQYYLDIVNHYHDESNNFNEQIAKIRDNFVNNTNIAVNKWLTNDEYNLDSLIPAMKKTLEYQLLPSTTEYNESNEYYIRTVTNGVIKYVKFSGSYEEWNYYLIHNKLYKAIITNSNSNDEAFAILDLFTDYVNSNQINTIKNALKEFYPAVAQDDTKKIVQQIKNNDILYAEKIDKLDKIKLTYLENKEIIQNEIDNLESEIVKLQLEQNDFRERLKEANDKLTFADLTTDIRDDLDLSDVPYTTGYFFDKVLVPNKYITNNLYLIIEYLNWLYVNQNLLIQEVGQIDESIHSGEEYGKFLKNYIDNYELEAFEFLHKYNSIAEDLSHGYDNILINNPIYAPGTDKYIYDLSHYTLDVYKDVLYLFDNEVDPEKSDELLLKLQSSNENIRKDGYKELESYIYKICYGKEKDNLYDSSTVSISIGVLLSPDGTKDQLVYFPNWPPINAEFQKTYYYPEVRTFGQNTQVLTNGTNNGNKITATGYQLLRYPIEENKRHLFDVPYNYNTKMYYVDPFQTDSLYYLKSTSTVSNLKFAFDGKDMTPEEFDEEVKKYKSIGEDLVWMTDDVPVYCQMTLHKFLYNCDIKNIEIDTIKNLDYYENLGLTVNPDDRFLLQPQIYYNYFKNYMGKIVHDVPSEGAPVYWPKPTSLFDTNEESTNEESTNEESTNEESTNEESTNEESTNEESTNEESTNEGQNGTIISFDDYGIPVGENITEDELEALGYIYNYGDEYGSYQGILEADITAFHLIASYFYAYKSLHILANIEPDPPESKEYIKTLIRYLLKIQGNLEEFEYQLKYWNNVINHSENVVLKEYQLLGVKDDTDEMKSLKEIISNAYDKVQYYEQLQKDWSIELNNLLKYNDILIDYFQAKKAANTVIKDLNSNKNKTSINCGIYYKKCDHYLKLLFNTQPFNVEINQDIISNKEILKINNNDTLSYNFGIASSLEKYKKFVGNLEYKNVDFSTILIKARDFEEKFYKYFPLIEPIELKGNLKSLEEFNNIDLESIKPGYAYEIIGNIINENFSVTLGDYIMAEFNANNQVIWKVIKSNDTDFKSNYCLMQMDNGSYLPYIYLDETNWKLDISNNKIFFTYFPNLKDFVNYIEYYKVDQDNNLEQFSINKKYYIRNEGKYKPITIKDENQFKDYKQILYFQGNGGLRRIIHDLIGLDYHHPRHDGHSFYGKLFGCRDNKYIEDIQTIYRGSLKLFNDLIEQTINDDLHLADVERLTELKTEYEVQLQDIAEDLQKLETVDIDQNEIIQNIYHKFAEYLYILTINYLQGVEGGYTI